MGSGKNTVGEIIQKLCITNNGPQFEQKAFAGKLKQIASLLTGIPVEKFENQEFKKQEMSEEWGMTYRVFLQKLGTEAMRDGLHENVWCNALFADYVPAVKEWDEFGNDTLIEYPSWCITDMRFLNEMEAVKERGGITIRVVRPVHALSQDNHCGILHPSETSLDNEEFDYTIVNDSTIEDLVEKVREILINEKIL